jgi:tetratricopeptide (TPR) repeat protein
LTLQRIRYLFIFILFLQSGSLLAQPETDEQLAAQFYQNKEFDKALEYYEKLYNKRSATAFYQPYLNCLLETKDFKKAEKVVKKQIKSAPDNFAPMVDLGTVYLRGGDPEKARTSWEQAVKSIRTDDHAFSAASAFIAIREFDHAISAYQKGRKVSLNGYPFSFELAEVYRLKNDRVSMINEYLDMLNISDSYMQTVQNSLQTSFGNDADVAQNEILKTELQKRIQRSPDKVVYSELLIWMQVQLRDWEGAFVQAKALDKRKKEDGGRLMALGQLFAQNEAYDMAVKAYQHVIAKGPDVYFYTAARMELLNALYTKVVSRGNYTPAELTDLDAQYTATIRELGKSASIVGLMKNHAHLKAFYLHQSAEAITTLEECIALPQLTATAQAECKLELADVLLMTGDIWEASLRYSQVEKSFKHDVIGQEAKFRNARISYYTGDFKWAQAQLDVLKGATSKLIANDAMNLSLLISDALAEDTNVAPLLIFARADLLMFQNKDEAAVRTLDSISPLFPNHALADEVIYKKSIIEMKHLRFKEASDFLNIIVKDYPEGILADDALFRLAELNEQQFASPENAKALYQKLLESYPGSLYVVEARKRFRKLRGDSIN